ncbi:MAG: peptidoglycan-binding domain-containing protein, partial [Methanobrevibacter sp.]|nr:peptidoglycan-binding domain-containing protein [Methanobrevibacter sp.]
GNTNYDKSTKDIKVTVKKATPKLTAKKKTFKTTPKTKKYTIVLKDNTGKVIKKAKVTLKVKGKTYKATTNSKGKATFKITKLNKKGTFKATITYKGNKYYNKVSKKAKIKVIVKFKTVSKGSKDKATVKEIQQALKDKGYYLTYQGHYLKVDGKFSSCTFRSIKEFQKDNGLKVTGKVDEKTAKKLGIL